MIQLYWLMLDLGMIGSLAFWTTGLRVEGSQWREMERNRCTAEKHPHIFMHRRPAFFDSLREQRDDDSGMGDMLHCFAQFFVSSY